MVLVVTSVTINALSRSGGRWHRSSAISSAACCAKAQTSDVLPVCSCPRLTDEQPGSRPGARSGRPTGRAGGPPWRRHGPRSPARACASRCRAAGTHAADLAAAAMCILAFVLALADAVPLAGQAVAGPGIQQGAHGCERDKLADPTTSRRIFSRYPHSSGATSAAID